MRLQSSGTGLMQASNRPKTRLDCPVTCGGKAAPLGGDRYQCGNCKRCWMGFELLWQNFQNVPCRGCKQPFGTNDPTDRLCPDCRFKACLGIAKKLNPALPIMPWELWHAVEATLEKLTACWCWGEQQQVWARQEIAKETARLERLPKKELRWLLAEMERGKRCDG